MNFRVYIFENGLKKFNYACDKYSLIYFDN